MIVPSGVIFPIASCVDSVNQRFPSGPVTIEYGRLSACGRGNSVTDARGAPANALGATTSSTKPKVTSNEPKKRLLIRVPLFAQGGA